VDNTTTLTALDAFTIRATAVFDYLTTGSLAEYLAAQISQSAETDAVAK
jgi:hypothetical protein